MKTWHIAVGALVFVVVWTASILMWKLGETSEATVDAGKAPLNESGASTGGKAGGEGTAPPTRQRDLPKLVVALKNTDGQLERGKKKVDFGVSVVQSTDSAEFVFLNDGAGPLTLKHDKNDSSCRCTIGHLSDGEVPPGGQTVVTLEWKTMDLVGAFRHHATIHTNDPKNPRVRLEVHGTVTHEVVILPSTELMLGRMGRHESRTVSFRVEGYVRDDFRITSCALEDPTAVRYVEFKTEKLAKEQLQEGALAGYQVQVTLKPGLPLGQFLQRIRLETNQSEPKILGLQATVVRDITVAGGPGWVADSAFLYLGQLDGNRDSEFTLHLLVRGPHRERTRLDVASTFPSALQATLGKPEKLELLVRWPLSIKVPRGTPAMNHLQSSDEGGIVIHSDHPDEEEQELTIPVAFAVTGSE